MANAAAPTIHSVEIYGNKRPSDCAIGSPAPTETQIDDCIADASFGPSALFANSQPRARYQRGLLWITGNADAGSIIDVTVTDAVTQNVDGDWVVAGRTARQSYMTAAQDVPDFGIEQGDFVESGDVPSLNVTDLGTHWAGAGGACKNGATAEGCDPTSPDPANWGPSTLYVFVVARDPSTGETSDPWTTDGLLPQITKYAGTPVLAGEGGDKLPPSASRATWPPRHWCHLSSRGAKDPFFSQNLGGDYDGRCGTASDNTFGAAPDLTWLLFGCYPPDQFPNPYPTEWRSAACRDGTNARTPTGESKISGTVNDDVSSAFGIASEIADISVEFVLGSEVVRPVSHPLVRSGPQAGYSQKVRINDFEPNYTGPGTTTPYTAQVAYFDAWGNTGTMSAQFTIYPW